MTSSHNNGYVYEIYCNINRYYSPGVLILGRCAGASQCQTNVHPYRTKLVDPKMRTLILSSILLYVICDAERYEDKRAKLLQDEFKLTLGGNINLTEKEEKVNECLMKYKTKELNYAFEYPEHFNLSRHFFSYKEIIRKSTVHKIIKDLPKGAVLHVHDMGILGPDYLMNITYMDSLYVCFGGNVQFRFAEKAPITPCATKWQLISEVRRLMKNVTDFDKNLRKVFTLVVDDPDATYPTITETWDAFMNYFVTVAPMLSFRPVWEQYFYDVLEVFMENNIIYVEVRSILPNLYELDGTTYDQLVTAKAYRKSINKFLKAHPDFVGAKLIFAPSRYVNNNTVSTDLGVAKEIKNNLGEYFAGFDLVGQEDKGKPLLDFIPELTDAGKELNYFFHAGETDWYGCLTDQNLVDAILLGAKRIGHAYALPKHPLLMKEVIKNDIGLEVNVISNAVLSLVRDVRNHPLSIFLANDMPVVLSSDDPGAWEADPLTDDFYVAFMGVASKQSDLRMLKKLALNSLQYSALSGEEKTNAFEKFNRKWSDFVNEFKCESY
jgi:adenosine deaminase CECR1